MSTSRSRASLPFPFAGSLARGSTRRERTRRREPSATWLQRFRSFFDPVPARVLSPERMQAELERAAARSARHGDTCTLLVYGLPGSDPDSMARALARRARSTDEVGRLSEDHMGVLLRDTLRPGAQVFRDHVRETHGYAPLDLVEIQREEPPVREHAPRESVDVWGRTRSMVGA